MMGGGGGPQQVCSSSSSSSRGLCAVARGCACRIAPPSQDAACASGVVKPRPCCSHAHDGYCFEWNFVDQSPPPSAPAVTPPPPPDVVDSTDSERLGEASEELQAILCDQEMKNTLVLVLANKQDLPRALPPSDIASKLGLRSIAQNRWFIQPACATTGEGLYEGLDWSSRELRKARTFN